MLFTHLFYVDIVIKRVRNNLVYISPSYVLCHALQSKFLNLIYILKLMAWNKSHDNNFIYRLI